VLECTSATSLPSLVDESVDLVVTDPPFGGLVQYAELSDFFHVWLRLALKDRYQKQFGSEYTPRILEAVRNQSRHPEAPDLFYQRILTECWKEALRMLKPGGILAFTFHHSEDEPWLAVLESLFDAGFFLEATYPVRSDETKGDSQFGSQKIEFDIIHVCRKRSDEPEPVSWARLRRHIMQDVQQLQEILEQHQESGLQEADLQVIRRGKALEYYSKHYGKVYVERGREFTVREALLGINQLLDEQADASAETPPVLAEAYTRQFFRLFADRTSLPRDQIQKHLRGTGVSPQEFVDRGWCEERQKVFYPISPLELARSWRGVPRSSMARDFDQTMFMVGACYEASGIKMTDTLDNPNFTPHPATPDILDWLTRHGWSQKIKDAAKIARQLYQSWQAKNQKKVEEQRTLFDLVENET
jgi:adenine-specific DNA methylase